MVTNNSISSSYLCNQLKQTKMKKLFVLFAAATLLVGFQACKHNEETATEETAVVEEAPAVDSSAVVATPDSAAAVVAVDSTKK